jgi:hypothetical protein
MAGAASSSPRHNGTSGGGSRKARVSWDQQPRGLGTDSTPRSPREAGSSRAASGPTSPQGPAPLKAQAATALGGGGGGGGPGSSDNGSGAAAADLSPQPPLPALSLPAAAAPLEEGISRAKSGWYFDPILVSGGDPRSLSAPGSPGREDGSAGGAAPGPHTSNLGRAPGSPRSCAPVRLRAAGRRNSNHEASRPILGGLARTCPANDEALLETQLSRQSLGSSGGGSSSSGMAWIASRLGFGGASLGGSGKRSSKDGGPRSAGKPGLPLAKARPEGGAMPDSGWPLFTTTDAGGAVTHVNNSRIKVGFCPAPLLSAGSSGSSSGGGAGGDGSGCPSAGTTSRGSSPSPHTAAALYGDCPFPELGRSR